MPVKLGREPLFALLLAALSAPASAACPADPAEVIAAAERGLAAWKDWAWADFEAATTEVETDLACLSAALPRSAAADVHLVLALRAGRAQDAAAATAAFRALLSVEPGYAPTEEEAAAGSFLRAAYDTARASGPGATAPLAGAGWWVDGAVASEVPTARAAIVQNSGPPWTSRYLSGLGPPGDLSAMAPRAPATAERRPSGGRASLALLGGAAGAGVASSLLFLVPARSTHEAYATAPEADLPRLETVNHASVIGGYALSAAAAGLAVGAVVRGQW